MHADVQGHHRCLNTGFSFVSFVSFVFNNLVE